MFFFDSQIFYDTLNKRGIFIKNKGTLEEMLKEIETTAQITVKAGQKTIYKSETKREKKYTLEIKNEKKIVVCQSHEENLEDFCEWFNQTFHAFQIEKKKDTIRKTLDKIEKKFVCVSFDFLKQKTKEEKGCHYKIKQTKEGTYFIASVSPLAHSLSSNTKERYRNETHFVRDGSLFTLDSVKSFSERLSENILQGDLLKQAEEEEQKKKVIETAFGVSLKDIINPVSIGRKLIHKELKHFHGEDVTWEEETFIDKAFRAGIMKVKTGKHTGKYSCFDVNSLYPSVMSQEDFLFPLIQGKITTQKERKQDEIGIYKITLEKEKLPFWFEDTTDDYYTTYDLEVLENKKIQYTLKQEENNSIVWEKKHCVSGRILFAHIMSLLYETKEKMEDKEQKAFVKLIMNSIWGTLTKKYTFKISFEDWENLPKEKVDRLRPKVAEFDINKKKVILASKERPFRHITGRMKPFLTAYGRKIMVQKIQDIEQGQGQEVIRVHTDSLLTTGTMQTGGEMGQMKLEYSLDSIEIKNLNHSSGYTKGVQCASFADFKKNGK